MLNFFTKKKPRLTTDELAQYKRTLESKIQKHIAPLMTEYLNKHGKDAAFIAKIFVELNVETFMGALKGEPNSLVLKGEPGSLVGLLSRVGENLIDKDSDLANKIMGELVRSMCPDGDNCKCDEVKGNQHG